MKKVICLLALVLGVQFCGTGCATIVTGGGEDQAVRFASNPRGATVYVDDNPVGQTPISVRLTRKDEHRVRIEHPGYKPYEKTIGSGFNEWILGNVIIGGLVGLGVDLLSGANPALDTNNVSAKMIKDDGAYARGAASPPAGYTTTGPPVPAPARPAAYLNTAAPPLAPAPAPAPAYDAPAAAPAPAYQPAASRNQPRPAMPTTNAPAPAQPARQQPPQQPAAKAGAYQGW